VRLALRCVIFLYLLSVIIKDSRLDLDLFSSLYSSFFGLFSDEEVRGQTHRVTGPFPGESSYFITIQSKKFSKENVFIGISRLPPGPEMDDFFIRKRSTSTKTLCQYYHLTNFALSVNQEDADATTETATVASKHSWDSLAYFSAEPSVTPEPGYVE
jgi:hypothetical protein